ncbi:unnamed protein product [Alopecurus aequalis]
MDEAKIFHLDFIELFEEVADHFDLDSPVVSSSEHIDGVGYLGALHAQFKSGDESSYQTVYGYGATAADACNNAAREALKRLHFTVNFAVVDLHMYEYWGLFMSLVLKEQQHRTEMAQLHEYHEVRKHRELEDLKQEHDGCVYEIEHDHNLEIEDRDKWLELEEQKSKKFKRERDLFEDMANQQASQISELMTENRFLRRKLVGEETAEDANSTT